MRLAYLNYGDQSGVTRSVASALVARGHQVVSLCATGPLELRDPRSGKRRVSAPAVLHLALAAARFGRRALDHRWNTAYAFDVHSQRAGELLQSLVDPPEAVLQNGALLSPGMPPVQPYALLLDNTGALATRAPPAPEAGLPPPPPFGEDWRRREAAVYQAASAIAAFSRRVAGSLSRDYRVPPERIRVVGAGANVFPERPERCDDGRTILFVGKDFRRKGGPILLQAFERLRRQVPLARLLIAGPSRSLQLPPGLIQLGFVPLSSLPDLCARATVFAMPTLREPYGLAFLDAMACGLPCVGTDLEAVPEIIQHGKTGLLVPPGDPDALAEALAYLLTHRSRARAMGERGRERIAAEFRWEHVVRRLEPVLEVARGASLGLGQG